MRISITAAMFAGAVALATSAYAQNTTGANDAASHPGAAAAHGMDHAMGSNVSGTNPNAGKQAASGNDNQAVATTATNASQPAHGHNSFTLGEARGRLSGNGFQDVKALHLKHGVWWGKASKNGTPVKVWLDYKGNVGQS